MIPAGTLARLPLLCVALIGVALLGAVPAEATTFSDPVGDNIGLNVNGETVTAPDMTYASHQLLADGRIELAMSFGPGNCKTVVSGGGTVETAPRATFALYTDSAAIAVPDFRIAYDTAEQSYVIRDNTSTRPNIAQIEGIDSGGIITVRFDPQYVGKPQQLRWMGSQTCKGWLPWEDVERVPNGGTYGLDLPFPPKPDPSGYDPPTQGTPDPLPDALPSTTTAAQGRMSTLATTAVQRLVGGIPDTGILLTFSGLPAGDVQVILGKRTLLARGDADTVAGTARLRLKPPKAGRHSLHGTGTLVTQVKLVFSPRGGGRQTTIIRRVTLKRRR